MLAVLALNRKPPGCKLNNSSRFSVLHNLKIQQRFFQIIYLIFNCCILMKKFRDFKGATIINLLWFQVRFFDFPVSSFAYLNSFLKSEQKVQKWGSRAKRVRVINDSDLNNCKKDQRETCTYLWLYMYVPIHISLDHHSCYTYTDMRASTRSVGTRRPFYLFTSNTLNLCLGSRQANRFSPIRNFSFRRTSSEAWFSDIRLS